jgi:hypothetical protein
MITIRNLPVQINLSMPGDPRDVIGFADIAVGNDGKAHIEIVLDEDATRNLGNLVEVFDLKAIGFAGIKRRPSALPSDG